MYTLLSHLKLTHGATINTMLKLQGVASVSSFKKSVKEQKEAWVLSLVSSTEEAGLHSEVQRPHFELFTPNKKLHLSVDELFTFKMGPPAEEGR